MKKTTNQIDRAHTAWAILTNVAHKNESITYSEIADKMNIHYISTGFDIFLKGTPPAHIYVSPIVLIFST